LIKVWAIGYHESSGVVNLSSAPAEKFPHLKRNYKCTRGVTPASFTAKEFFSKFAKKKYLVDCLKGLQNLNLILGSR
jgi:hypothetical protein